MTTEAPVIHGVAGKLSALERRIEYLKTRLENPVNPRAADFDRAELAAIQAGAWALEYHRKAARGEEMALEVLRDLVRAIKDDVSDAEFGAVVERAEDVLEMTRL